MAEKKTDIKVTAVYDGMLDASDVFASLITQKYLQRYQQKHLTGCGQKHAGDNEKMGETERENLAEGQAGQYNDVEGVLSHMPSGLCG